MGRFEVTNREFRRFVEAGGYDRREFRGCRTPSAGTG
jgi:formylglycine-generating enzyme required for sulfatase activity